MTRNPYDPNVDPFRWMAYEMELNRRAYYERCPEERGLKPWEASEKRRGR